LVVIQGTHKHIKKRARRFAGRHGAGSARSWREGLKDLRAGWSLGKNAACRWQVLKPAPWLAGKYLNSTCIYFGYLIR
jgi:hypothetical protein